MKETIKKALQRQRRHHKIRAKISGTAIKPRLVVFKSKQFIYGQLIDDVNGVTMAASSDMKISEGKKMEKAKDAGKLIADIAKEKKISTCVFDRNGYKYIGRVKNFAEGARENGLQF